MLVRDIRVPSFNTESYILRVDINFFFLAKNSSNFGKIRFFPPIFPPEKGGGNMTFYSVFFIHGNLKNLKIIAFEPRKTLKSHRKVK